MTEDPLERLDREENEKKNSGLKKTMYLMIALVVALAALLAYIWISKALLVRDLNSEKEDLTAQIVTLQSDYDALSTENIQISSQLDSSREEVAQLVERIKKTDATNRAKMRQYEKELGTLRTIMKSYIVQIDSLNTLNQKLTADAVAARREAAESRRANEELSQRVENLSGQVAAGAVVKARGIRIEAYGANDRPTDRSSRVVRMLTTLSLVENDLAPKGPMRVYIRVKDPDGILLTNGTQKLAFFDSRWNSWKESGFSVDNGFPIVGDVKPEYDVYGCAALCRVIRGGYDWTAAAKPFGSVENLEGEQDVVTCLKRLVTAAFSEVRLVPIDSVGGRDLHTADYDWMIHIRDHLPKYFTSGPPHNGCWYCQQLVCWENLAFRESGKRWLQYHSKECVRPRPGPGNDHGGTSHAH